MDICGLIKIQIIFSDYSDDVFHLHPSDLKHSVHKKVLPFERQKFREQQVKKFKMV